LLSDNPAWNVVHFAQDFETHVMCVEGWERGQVYGGVKWGQSWESSDPWQHDGWYKYYSYAERSNTPSSTFQRLVSKFLIPF
jgi:hypothetical protein